MGKPISKRNYLVYTNSLWLDIDIAAGMLKASPEQLQQFRKVELTVAEKTRRFVDIYDVRQALEYEGFNRDEPLPEKERRHLLRSLLSWQTAVRTNLSRNMMNEFLEARYADTREPDGDVPYAPASVPKSKRTRGGR